MHVIMFYKNVYVKLFIWIIFLGTDIIKLFLKLLFKKAKSNSRQNALEVKLLHFAFRKSVSKHVYVFCWMSIKLSSIDFYMYTYMLLLLLLFAF